MENVLSDYKWSPHEVESRIIKKKRVNLLVGLSVNISCAEGIDSPSLHPSVVKRHYCVVFWVEPGEEFYTSLTQGLLDPVWNETAFIAFEKNSDNYAFLNVEVLRLNSNNDPGTSTGCALVGRARIPLPKVLNREKAGRFGLVRAEGEGYKAEGHIILSMELKRFRIT